MKKIMLVAIVFNSYCMAGELAPLLPKESKETTVPKVSKQMSLFEQIFGPYSPGESGAFEWLQLVLPEVKLEKAQCEKFLNDWWKILQELNKNGSFSVIELVRHIAKINSKSNLLPNNPALFVNMVMEQAKRKQEEKLKYGNEFNIAQAEAKIEWLFYWEKLWELLGESEQQTQFPELAKFALRKSKNDQDLIELLQDKYQYVLTGRFFGESFYEVRFLRNKETNKIIKLEKKMAEEPSSVEYCIAELLRNALFLSKATKKRFVKNGLTDSPYAPYAYMTNNKPYNDYAKGVEDLWRKLKDFYSPEKTVYKEDAIDALIYQANSKSENLLSDFEFKLMEPERRENFLKLQKKNLDVAHARNLISYSAYKTLLEQRWRIDYVEQVHNGVTSYRINHLYRKIP